MLVPLLWILTLTLTTTKALPPSNGNSPISLLDIVKSPQEALELETLLENSPGHSYIRPELLNVDLLQVYILDGRDDSVINVMEVETNELAAAYRGVMYGEVEGKGRCCV